MINFENVSDPLTRRVLEFVESKGGPSHVGRAINKKPALFYNLESGRNKRPSAETLDLLAATFPDFDPTSIMSGKGESMSDDVKQLRKALAERDQRISKLEGKVEQYEQIMIEFAKQGFPGANSQFTALPYYHTEQSEPRVEVAGFGREPKYKATTMFMQYVEVTIGQLQAAGYWCAPFVSLDSKGN